MIKRGTILHSAWVASEYFIHPKLLLRFTLWRSKIKIFFDNLSNHSRIFRKSGFRHLSVSGLHYNFKFVPWGKFIILLLIFFVSFLFCYVKILKQSFTLRVCFILFITCWWEASNYFIRQLYKITPWNCNLIESIVAWFFQVWNT